MDEPKKSQSRRLEGITPNKFKEDRGKTLTFLTQFKWYILMNYDMLITHDSKTTDDRMYPMPCPVGNLIYINQMLGQKEVGRRKIRWQGIRW